MPSAHALLVFNFFQENELQQAKRDTNIERKSHSKQAGIVSTVYRRTDKVP